MRYSTQPTFRNTLKDMAFCHLQENLVINDTATKTGMDPAKIASKRVAHKTAEAT